MAITTFRFLGGQGQRWVVVALAWWVLLALADVSVAEPAYQFDDLSGVSWVGGRQIDLRVIDRDQAPVAGAKVQVGTWRDSAYLRMQGGPHHPERVPQTDAEGRLSCELPDNFAVVVITHDRGVALIDPSYLLEHRGEWTAQLEPWSSVKGRVVDDRGRALPGETVRMSLGHWTANALNPLLDTGYSVTTDDHGAFEFLRVPPGEVRLAYRLKAPPDDPGRYVVRSGRSVVLRAEPGLTHEVQVGGGGIALRGRLAVESTGDTPIDLHGVRVVLVPRVEADDEPPRHRKPEAFAAWSDEKRSAWREARSRTRRTLEYDRWWALTNFNRRATRKIDVAADGFFAALDVESGEYVLEVAYRGMHTQKLPIDIVAPDPLTSPTESELDLGTIWLSPRPALVVGDVLPGFTATLLPLTDPPTVVAWEQFKGRYVLIDFWATWCGPCLTEIPYLQAVAERFDADERFVFLSVSLDALAAPATRYVEAKSPKGVQTWLSPEQSVVRAAAIPLAQIPSIWLIGPDGTIRAQGLRGEETMAVVAEALAADPGGGR